MNDSVTFQSILQEAEEKAFQRRLELARNLAYLANWWKGFLQGQMTVVLASGTKRFGHPPNSVILATLLSIDDNRRIEELSLRLFDVNTWEELLANS